MFKKTLIAAIALAVSLLTLTGCGPFWVDPYITVKQSHLNWIRINYYDLRSKPVKRITLYINGTGHVEVRKGKSDLVSNDFAKGYNKDEWEDIRTRRVAVSPEHANDTFQHLVNFGVLDSEKFFRGTNNDKIDRFISVKANINNYSYTESANIFETDPDLAEHLLDVIREYDSFSY